MKLYVPASPLSPYLYPVPNHFSLKISLNTEDPAVLEKSPFPFSRVVDSDPLTLLNEGLLLTDAGSEIKKVFILAQRDQCLCKQEDLRPIFNPEIEEFWQRAYSFLGSGKESSVVLLSAQMKESGGLAPFQSLFFCKTRKVFFPPPCPTCGSPLELCQDDDLLLRVGLQPYSTSLKRYLFCPIVHAPEVPSFFVDELDNSDPPNVMDRKSLIREFGRLLDKKDQTGQFPCISCSLRQECYGNEHMALVRIVPFAFYPFYAFIFEAPSLNGADFLSLLSGATFEALEGHLKAGGEWGRIRCLKALNRGGLKEAPSLYGNDERFFLEVLYLKLSFLAEMIRGVPLDRAIFSHPDLRLSLDRFWVKLEEPSGLLPFFWNFKLKYIGLFRNPGESGATSPSSSSEGLFFLGQVWFYTLLANRQQNMTVVSSSLKRASDQSLSRKDIPQEKPFPENNDPVFLPENIFWNSEGKKVNKSWIPLWERSLEMGWQLIRMGWQKDPPWSKNDFLGQLETLRGDVKNQLFSPAPSGIIPAVSVEGIAIRDALLRIREKWRRDHPPEKPEKEEMKETIILSPQAVQGETKAPSLPGKDREMVPETVILSPEKLRQKSLKVDKEVPETVILSPGDAAKKTRRPAGSEVTRRIIIEKSPVSKAAEEVRKKKEEQADDLMSETVILGPEKIRELSKKRKD